MKKLGKWAFCLRWFTAMYLLVLFVLACVVGIAINDTFFYIGGALFALAVLSWAIPKH